MTNRPLPAVQLIAPLPSPAAVGALYVRTLERLGILAAIAREIEPGLDGQANAGRPPLPVEDDGAVSGEEVTVMK